MDCEQAGGFHHSGGLPVDGGLDFLRGEIFRNSAMIYIVIREIIDGYNIPIMFFHEAFRSQEAAEAKARELSESEALQDAARVLGVRFKHRVQYFYEAKGLESVKRGDLSEPLGGFAGGAGSNFKYLICGNCTPEPIHEEALVFYKVRRIGLPVTAMGGTILSVDVLECPKCGHQVLR